MELALVDFDHTVTTCDTYGRFLRHVATPEQLASSRWSVGPWVAGYRLGLVSASALRVRVTRKVFNGRDAAEIAAIGADYARDVLPRVVRPEMLGRIAEHRARGHEVVIVSGSLDVYLEPWCRSHGLEWICNRLQSEDGRLTGHYAGGDRGAHKVTDIRSRYDLSRYSRIHAYGDSSEDRAMLALAHERWWRGQRVA